MISHKLAWIFSIGTFLFGMFADSWLNLQRPLPEVEVDHTYRIPGPNLPINGKMQIELVSTRKLGRGKREATFKVLNRKNHAVTFPGYSKDDPAQVWIRQKGSIRDAIELACWMGIDTQTLEPTETAYFTIPIPPKGGYFDIGFDFRISLRAGWETVWFRFPEYPNRRR
jgi:hypothetical protein